MKRNLFVIFTLLSALFSHRVMASHGVGADLHYVCTGGNTYEFELSFYRDCAGILPSTPSLSVSGCGVSGTIAMTQVGLPIELAGVCPNMTTCSTPAGVYPGVQKYTYRGTYTFTTTCANWKVSFGQCCRSNAISNLASPASVDLYVDTYVNNLLAGGDNSPVFSALPSVFLCAGQPATCNFGAIDPDGDELEYSLAQPRTNATRAVKF